MIINIQPKLGELLQTKSFAHLSQTSKTQNIKLIINK